MEAEMPEWLQEITEEDADIPDWLQGFDETREEEIDSLAEEGVAPSKVQAEVTFEGQEDLPDWLRDLGEEAEPEVGYESEAPELSAEEIADEEEEPILGDTKPMRVAREEFETEPVELEAGVEEFEEAEELQEEDLIPAAAEQEEESRWTWLESLESREDELEQEVSIPEEELEQEVSIPEGEQAGEPIEWIDEPEIEAEQAFEPSAEETEAAELVDELAEEMIDEEQAAGVEEIEKPSEEVPSLDEEPEYEVQAEAPVQDLGEPEFLVDINSASLAELERIPDVGFTMAQNIIAHRETYGPFRNLDEIQNVTGIGPVTAEELKKWVVLESVPEEMPAPEDSDLLTLDNAREVLDAGDIGQAVGHYNQLIKDEQFIDEVVEDLQKAIDRHPMEIELYQALGDALMRKNQLQDALDVYTKAEELLR
jgi:competence protein ComEA